MKGKSYTTGPEQSKPDFEIKAREFELALTMLVRAFEKADKNKTQSTWFDRAKYLLIKNFDPADVLRNDVSEKNYPIESTTPGFPELEKALFVANDAIGWKSLTSFIVEWTNKHQPKTVYTLKFWINPH